MEGQVRFGNKKAEKPGKNGLFTKISAACASK